MDFFNNRNLAESWFCKDGLSISEIADLLALPRATICAWVARYKWVRKETPAKAAAFADNMRATAATEVERLSTSVAPTRKLPSVEDWSVTFKDGRPPLRGLDAVNFVHAHIKSDDYKLPAMFSAVELRESDGEQERLTVVRRL